MRAERRVQRLFIKSFILSSLLIVAPIIAFERWSKSLPSRLAMGARTISARATPVTLSRGDRRTVRAWSIDAPDPRFGGISALALDRGELLAITDSGVLIRFAPPGRDDRITMRVKDLPAGPGAVYRKSGNDAESLIADPAGRGWWVGFEQIHSLLLFDRGFAGLIEKRKLKTEWPDNVGAESLVINRRGRVAVLPEGGAGAIPNGASDATRLPDGRLALLVRRFTWHGFASEIRIGGGNGHRARTIRLELGPLVIPEGIAAAPRPDGGTRLWIVSDDNFRPWMRTLLVALDLPPGA